jgi:hypothetical protein
MKLSSSSARRRDCNPSSRNSVQTIKTELSFYGFYGFLESWEKR